MVGDAFVLDASVTAAWCFADEATERSAMRLPIETDPESESRAHGPVLALARAHDLAPYDGAYLDLAIRNSLPLATRDRDLIRAAHRCGVVLIEA